MRKEFLGGVAKNEDKAVKVFIAAPSNADSALKTKPKVSCCWSCAHRCAVLVLEIVRSSSKPSMMLLLPMRRFEVAAISAHCCTVSHHVTSMLVEGARRAHCLESCIGERLTSIAARGATFVTLCPRSAVTAVAVECPHGRARRSASSCHRALPLCRHNFKGCITCFL